MSQTRRRLQRRPQEEVGLQIAPMIDVTLLLLFFFMLTGKLTKGSHMMNIDLPIAKTAVVPDDLSGRDVINIDAAGQYFAGDQPVDAKGLRAYLKQRLIDVPPLRLYIRADAQTPALKIKEVMKACAEAGAVEVIFATYQR